MPSRKKHTLTPLSSHKMSKTLSDVSPHDLEEARKMLDKEKAKLRDESHSLAPPPSGDIEEGRYSTTSSEDIRETGIVAKQFIEGMTQVQDVLLILVLKYGRATTVLLAVLIGLVPVTLILIWILVVNYSQQATTEELVHKLSDIQKEQKSILRKVNEAATQAAAAEAKAAEARDAAPKVILDDKGKAKLVVKGEEEEEVGPKRSQPTPSIEIDLNIPSKK